jgi:Gpi18-like mannosyltransferase
MLSRLWKVALDFFKDWQLVFIACLCFATTMMLNCIFFIVFTYYSSQIPTWDTFVYFLLLSTMLAVATFFMLRKEKKISCIAITIGLVTASLVLRMLFADFQSYDYKVYLMKWTNEYRHSSLSGALNSTISDYMPLYNYFLIIFSKIPMYDLYLIKLLSTFFEVATAVLIVHIISKISKKAVNPIIFAIVLMFPLFFIDSVILCQCDAIYTFFGLLGFYLIIIKKPIWACVSLGISLAFKFQAILLFPAIFIFLFVKNDEGKSYVKWWQFILIPAMFFTLNCIPLFTGRSFRSTYNAYYRQTSYVHGRKELSFLLNLPSFLNGFLDKSFSVWVVVFVMVTAIWLVIVLFNAIKTVRLQKNPDLKNLVFVSYYILLGTMFFMPLMYDRFVYFALMFGLIYLVMNLNKETLLVYFAVTCWAITNYAFAMYVLSDELSELKDSLILSRTMIEVFSNFARVIAIAIFVFLTVEFVQHCKRGFTSDEKNNPG